MKSTVDIQSWQMQQQSQELQGLRTDMQLLINLLRGAAGGIPNTSTSGTGNDDRAANSVEVLHSYLYIGSGIVEIANYVLLSNYICHCMEYVVS